MQLGSDVYEKNLQRLKQAFLSRCVFNKNNLIDSLSFSFSDDGILTGSFLGRNEPEGCDGRMSVGIIASVIDASMGQCLMGHGVAAYTVDLSIRFRFPVLLGTEARTRTSITAVDLEQVYHLETHIIQENKVCVRATSKFFRIN